MSVSDVNVKIQDGGLGLLPAATDANRVLLGTSSKGSTGEMLAFTSKKKVVESLGAGPLVDAIAHSLEVAGGVVYGMRVATVEDGVVGEVTKTGTSPILTAKGKPVDAYNVVVKVIKAGAAGTATVRASLDDGDTFGAELVVPVGAPGIIKAGDADELELEFVAGTYAAGDTYEFACTASSPTAAEIGAALDKVLLDSREWGFAQVVSVPKSLADSKALATMLAGKIAAAGTAHRYAVGVMDAAPGTDAALLSEFATFASADVMVCAGQAGLASPVTGRFAARPAGFVIGARLAKAPVHEDLGRYASGPLPGVLGLTRDERETPSLDEGRFATLRTFVGTGGFFITHGRLMAPAGSDYRNVQHRRVINLARKTARNALMRYLNDTVLVDRDTGFILEAEARAIEGSIRSQLVAAVVAPGHASDVDVQIPRDENILSSEQLNVLISVIPLGYLSSIEAVVALANPALQPA